MTWLTQLTGIASILLGLASLFYSLNVQWMEPPPLSALIVFFYFPLVAELLLIGFGIFLLVGRNSPPKIKQTRNSGKITR
jgi:hypothetical protein